MGTAIAFSLLIACGAPSLLGWAVANRLASREDGR
jgi:hypothetical protein